MAIVVAVPAASPSMVTLAERATSVSARPPAIGNGRGDARARLNGVASCRFQNSIRSGYSSGLLASINDGRDVAQIRVLRLRRRQVAERTT
jgi:hypothetical protein